MKRNAPAFLLVLVFSFLAWFGRDGERSANAQAPMPSSFVAATSGTSPGGAAGGDLAGTFPNPTVVNLSNVSNASLANSGLVNAFTTPNGVTCTLGAACSVPTAILTGNSAGNTVGASSTVYLGLGTTSPNAAQNQRYFIAPRAGTLKGFYLTTSSTQNAGGTMVIAVTQNGTMPSAVKVTVTAGSGAATFSDTSDSLTVAAGDLLSFQAVNNYSGGVSAIIGAYSVGFY